MTDILPTHHCFDDAIEFIEEVARQKEDRFRVELLVLVHAICEVPSHDPTGAPYVHAGTRYAHAWVEELRPRSERYVWDCGLVDGQRTYFAVKAHEYYTARRIVRTVRYSLPEMLSQNKASNHYGPWDPEIRELARPGDAASLGTFDRIPATYTPEAD